jgi:hypothetical protein
VAIKKAGSGDDADFVVWVVWCGLGHCCVVFCIYRVDNLSLN